MSLVVWGVFAAVFIAIAILSSLYFYRLHGSFDGNSIVTVCLATMSILVCVAKLGIVVLDMYDVMYLNSEHEKAVREFYYSLDSIVVVFAFMVLPFVYTYCNDYFNSWRNAASDRPSQAKRLGLSFLSTVPAVLAITAIGVIGAEVDFSLDESAEGVQPWINFTSRNLSETEKIFQLLSSSLGLSGIPFFILYAGAGMALIPLLLLKKKPTREEVSQANEQLEDEVSTVTERMKTIKSKYLNRLATPVDDRDRLNYDKHDKYKTQLEESQEMLSGQDTEGGCSPRSILRKVFGLIIMLLALLFIGSVASGRIYALINSDCGWRCAFVDDDLPGWYNPIQKLLNESQQSITVIFISIVLSLVFVSILAAINRLGINILCIKHNVSEKPVESQAIHLECIVLMLCCCTLSTWLPTVIPEYMVFGDQSFQGKQCSFGNFNNYDIIYTDTMTASLRTPSATGTSSNSESISRTISISVPLPTDTVTATLPTSTKSLTSSLQLPTDTSTETLSISLTNSLTTSDSLSPTKTFTKSDSILVVSRTQTQTETIPIKSITATVTPTVTPTITEQPVNVANQRVLLQLTEERHTRNSSHVEETKCRMTEIGKLIYSLRLTHPLFSISDIVTSFGLVLCFVGYLVFFIVSGSESLLPSDMKSRRGYTYVESVFQPSRDDDYEFV